MKDVAKTAMCSDHNCVFRVAFPELKGGMGTNGGCHCLDGLEHEKRIVVGTIVVDYGRLEKRVEELEKALRECHWSHTHPTVCSNRVDMFFHQLFPSEYNPHKALEGKKE